MFILHYYMVQQPKEYFLRIHLSTLQWVVRKSWNQKAPWRVQLLATSVRLAAIIMCWYVQAAKHNFWFRGKPRTQLYVRVNCKPS